MFEKLTVLSIAPILAKAITEVFTDGSVTSMFEDGPDASQASLFECRRSDPGGLVALALGRLLLILGEGAHPRLVDVGTVIDVVGARRRCRGDRR